MFLHLVTLQNKSNSCFYFVMLPDGEIKIVPCESCKRRALVIVYETEADLGFPKSLAPSLNGGGQLIIRPIFP